MKKKVLFILVIMMTLVMKISSVYAVKGDVSFMKSSYVSCGGDGKTLIGDIPVIIPNVTSTIFNVVMIIIPVVMVLMGVIDLIKGIASQKEDEIKKGRQSFAKRLFAGAATLLIVLLVKTLVTILAGGSANGIIGCVDCFVNGKSSCQVGTEG
jgi:hypothetical protein